MCPKYQPRGMTLQSAAIWQHCSNLKWRVFVLSGHSPQGGKKFFSSTTSFPISLDEKKEIQKSLCSLRSGLVGAGISNPKRTKNSLKSSTFWLIQYEAPTSICLHGYLTRTPLYVYLYCKCINVTTGSLSDILQQIYLQQYISHKVMKTLFGEFKKVCLSSFFGSYYSSLIPRFRQSQYSLHNTVLSYFQAYTPSRIFLLSSLHKTPPVPKKTTTTTTTTTTTNSHSTGIQIPVQNYE